MCTARQHSKWEWMEVCIEDQYKCDGVLHCWNDEDEVGCSQEATERCASECDEHYKQPEGGDCGEKLKCTARAGKWAGFKICLDKKFKCDNYVQCEDAKDEENCEKEYLDRGIFTHDQRHRCQHPFLETKTGKFFPMRAVR